MASNVYPRTTADGKTSWYSRKGTQGASRKSDDIKNTHTVIIHMTEREYKMFVELQEKTYMKKSAFGRIVLFLGLESYLNQTIG